ncbi:30S ribosomal protein S13 [Candidatus Woesearchaeota archaeon]|nr:30S ribosomal protein S13 [Candidatus Woesearchaeota archaeon]
MAEELKQQQQQQKQQQPQQGRPQPAVQTFHSDNPNFRHIVRIANTDLSGNKSVLMGLQKIKGVSFMIANAYCKLTGTNPTKKVGDLSEAEVQKLDLLIRSKNPEGIPSWMLNRRNDLETGKDTHLTGADLTFSHESDIRMLKKIKCYRGIRHIQNAPVRGQRTRSNFRKNKGKVASVKRSVVAKAAAAEKAKEKK